jgi:DNA-binding transcriptional ArsR family regulator
MASLEEETYSIMFTSLKHPARRKILRMLAKKPRNFSKILEELGLSSSHLTYHLENLGELVSKMEDGRYKLSTFGEAAVITMSKVEEAPVSMPSQAFPALMKWRVFFAVIMIVLVILAGVSFAQYASLSHVSAEYQQISEEHEQLKAELEQVSAEYERLLSLSAPVGGSSFLTPINIAIDSVGMHSIELSVLVKSVAFLKDVIQLDMPKYGVTLVGYFVENRSDSDGLVEENLNYICESNESKLNVDFVFRNRTLTWCSLHVREGSPLYTEPSNNVLDLAKSILQRYQTYTGSPDLKVMIDVLNTINVIENIETTLGNVKLNVTSRTDYVAFKWTYTLGGLDFPAITIEFLKGTFSGFGDIWSIYKVGSADVNVSREEAINIARERARDYSWTVNGVEITEFNILEEPVDAELLKYPTEDTLTLRPYWYVTLHLDKVYLGNVDRIQVGIWADTAEVIFCQERSGGGS